MPHFVLIPYKTQLIAKHGYRQETHHVTTDDGYILELHRIHTAGGQPVLLMHGILDSSATWVLNGPKSGLGISTDLTCLFQARPLFIHSFYSQRSFYRIWDMMYGWEIHVEIPIRETINT